MRGILHTFPHSHFVAFGISTAVISHNRVFPMAISNNFSVGPFRVSVAAHLAHLVAAQAPSDTAEYVESLRGGEDAVVQRRHPPVGVAGGERR